MWQVNDVWKLPFKKKKKTHTHPYTWEKLAGTSRAHLNLLHPFWLHYNRLGRCWKNPEARILNTGWHHTGNEPKGDNFDNLDLCHDCDFYFRHLDRFLAAWSSEVVSELSDFENHATVSLLEKFSHFPMSLSSARLENICSWVKCIF